MVSITAHEELKALSKLSEPLFIRTEAPIGLNALECNEYAHHHHPLSVTLLDDPLVDELLKQYPGICACVDINRLML